MLSFVCVPVLPVLLVMPVLPVMPVLSKRVILESWDDFKYPRIEQGKKKALLDRALKNGGTEGT